MKETELAAKVVAYLEADGWTVYQEVLVGPGVADIIALREAGRSIPLIRHIECKTTLSVDLVAQATDALRTHHAHFVEVAIPKRSRTTRGQSFLRRTLREHGVGMLEVYSYDGGRTVWEAEAPRLRRIDRYPDPGAVRRNWLKRLRATRDWCDRHVDLVPAGTNGGGHWTPYKGTMREIRDFLKQKGEATLAEIMDAVSFHYSSAKSARSCIPHALQKFETDWCETEKRGGKLYFRVREDAS